MTRTKNWLLIGTVLPGLTLSHGGFAVEPAQAPMRLAQAPAPSDEEPGQPRRPRPPGAPAAPGEARPPGAERPRPAPGAP
ncbi:hypothetical protein AB4118_15165, partial [Bosea sp. 2RAB26]